MYIETLDAVYEDIESLSKMLGVQKSSELFFVKFNLYSKTNEKIWLAA